MPSTVRLTSAQAVVGVAHSTVRLTSAQALASVAHSTVRLTSAQATSTISTALEARPGPARFVESYIPVTLDGTGSTGGWVQASWSVVGDTRTQEPGLPAPVPITIDGADVDSVVTVFMPPHPQNYQATFRLSITDGVDIRTALVTHTVYAWLFWYLDPSGKVLPEVIYG